ncbi:DSD1 family PLP-dependent enzyme [Hespellia stercorisuis]|uniref:D-serine deaminase, pyridoxal phosphate-dependent n=1 Tax=Hespellia stercorisuis DSM 15480 TaxID=1121950 RepID=A0A1M6KAS0_9FIRM|nr:DSD1 family PLP-dependent enzyme [Hespellia stercorisuis]SHJ56032.1 D-serine deaminase, pyridoxal phosphate-dependent [Hespellia stercorisuis DSM 15480]
MLVSQVETPALIVDLDSLEENLCLFKEQAEKTGIAMRPHFKSNKCPAIVHKQIEYGAKGITCSKVEEAEDLIDCGIKDVLIANQIVDKGKIASVATLAGRCHLGVCVDNAKNIDDLEAAAAVQDNIIYCLVEFEIGMNRCGVTTKEELYDLAAKITAYPHLRFEGIQAYAGHLSHEEDFEKRQSASDEVEKKLTEAKEYVESKGIKVKEVSGSSTGTVFFRPKGSVYTELQAGSYVFMDVAYGKLKLPFKHSLFVLSTVISTENNKIIVDAGRKSAASDQALPIFLEYPDIPAKVSEEHTAIPKENRDVLVGDRLHLIPGHCCTTVNIHDSLYLVRKGEIVDRVAISSRGKSR